ncbi:hypothetical protein [Paractinoplanes lichenicola]|uniref:Uncharacterized protein n=1 Tax=Paractinoplanes lichenicola TaxID=2802976 RepID=A0ABS1VJJ5_9ACTN|nr:hypothetical protein [Actinoplanes lichenicola]MBL7254890.1 hypothetical protein [Actinoplanes lichenicola]
MAEIYVSTDVETDGPIPGRHSLLSFGSAAFRADGTYTAGHDGLVGEEPRRVAACRSNHLWFAMRHAAGSRPAR